MKQRIKLSKWAKMNGYTYHGAYKVYRAGKIPNAIQTETGTVLVEIESEDTSRPEYTVVYARVSSSENKNNLESQAKRVKEYCMANGWQVHEVVKECASGLNDHRPKLQKILSDDKVTRIVVEHKDRLTRFGFAYIETLFQGDVVVINHTDDEEDDIMQDLVSIITSFCARIYGKRRSSRKTEKLIAELQKDD